MKFPMPSAGRLLWAVLALYWVAMFVGTHVPPDDRPRGPGHDKLMHFTAYAGLGLLMGAALRASYPGRHRLLWLILPVGAAYGIADELLQPLVRRSAELLDWTADVGGLAF